MSTKRTYENDGCAAAHALELIGERWALLVVRELMLGPKRFTDLRTDLPHISPNVLSQRLRDLEGINAITKHTLPPPAASQVYELTPWGYQLEPILQQLGRWASQSPTMPLGAPVTMATLVMGMRTMFQAAAAHELGASYEIRSGPNQFRVTVTDGQLEVARGHATNPVLTIQSDPTTIKSMMFAGLPPQQAIQEGQVQLLVGDERELERFLKLFKLPDVIHP